MSGKPALSLIAVPGKRQAALDLAGEIEKRGFSGIHCPSYGDCVGLCEALAFITNEIEFGTSIHSIYSRNPIDLARTSSFIHEASQGRFHLGLGVSHQVMNDMMGAKTGKPLSDMRNYVDAMRAAEQQAGKLPPITLATLRDKMLQLSSEIGQGAVYANGALSHMKTQLGANLTVEQRAGDFFIGSMIPTVIDDDEQAAAAVNRKTLTMYVQLPNYRNYWKAAGFEEEMTDIEAAIEKGDTDRLTTCMSDRWLSDITLFGSAAKVREGVEAWVDAGVKTPILVPSSTKGGMFKAFEEVMAIFD